MEIIGVKGFPQSLGVLLQLELRFKLSSMTYRTLPTFLTSFPTNILFVICEFPSPLFLSMPSSFLPQGLGTGCSPCLDCTSPRFLKARLFIIVVYLLSCASSLASPHKSPVSSWPSLILSLCLLSFLASTSSRCSYVSAVSPFSRALSLFFNLVSSVPTKETNRVGDPMYLLY